jgi:hypothetical protein
VAGFVDSVLSNVTVFRCSDVADSNSPIPPHLPRAPQLLPATKPICCLL